MAKSLFQNGVRVEIDAAALDDFIRSNKSVRDLLVGLGQKVAANAQATASKAELGPGGRITGYADAGFSVEWEQRGQLPRVNVRSNADGETATKVHFYTQKRDGVAHLRKALYDETGRA